MKSDNKKVPSKFFYQDEKSFEIKEIERINAKPKEERTIFISVASYRDAECPNTIKEIFTKADYPNRIIVGICQQNSGEDVDCFDPKYKDNVRIIRFSDKEAKGPTYARYMCSKLYKDEDYYMQIDSHTHFEKGFDTICIDMMSELFNDPNIKNKKTVLSAYPNDWLTEKDETKLISAFCTAEWSNGMLKSRGALIQPPKNLQLSPFVAAGFFFTYGVFLRQVQYDPDLPHLFEGEEMLFAARLWTSGWDFYTPNKVILYHYYGREEAPKYWTNPEFQKYNPMAFQKAQYLLKLTDNAPDNLPMNYLMGTERTIEDFYQFIGFNLENKDTPITKNFCS